MFVELKKKYRKIVAAILSVLVLLLFGTVCVIYLASYMEMTNENRRYLKQYVEAYTIPGAPGQDGREEPLREARPGRPPMLELSTFYSVAVSESGEVLKTDTADVSTISEDALTELAAAIIKSGKESGVERNLIYQRADKDGYILVAFLDNTLMLESAGTLLYYTLIFGGAALVPLFFLARCLARRIVSPLEESFQKQRRFVSDAGHELKTPVAVVNANIELLSREIGENRWLSNIRYENERMSALIIQLLELARAENAAPKMEPVDLSRLTCGEALPFEPAAYENGLVLTSDIAEGIRVEGDSVQLKQLVSILLDNAVRHGTGGEVRIALKKEKGHAVLSVANDGEPIPPEQQAHLFERFWRGDAARSGEGGHYGLGLAIAHAIAASHKGSLGVRCRGGKVIFTAKLPLKKQGAAQEGFPSCMAVCTNTIFCFLPVDKAGIFV